ncbi:MAG: hypothetical protein AAF205_09995 [Pseudomonadota bacterium]
MTNRATDHPPRPALALNIGITGHRAGKLPAELRDAAQDRLNEVFAAIAHAARQFETKQSTNIRDGVCSLTLHTPLATGADQMAANAARAVDMSVRAVLPFDPETYAHDFEPGQERDQYSDQLSLADAVFALDGRREHGPEPYVSVGEAIASKADILIALWDGQPAKGRGGTGQIVEIALGRGIPVICIPVLPGTPARIGPVHKIPSRNDDAPGTPSAAKVDYDALIRTVLVTPKGSEKLLLKSFLRERERRWNARIEFPLLLAMVGAKPFRLSSVRQPDYDEDIADDLKTFERRRDLLGDQFVNRAGTVHSAYAWANGLAIRYAQLFRSSHVLNYILSASAVLLALAGLVAPAAKFELVLLELAAIGALFVNTQAGRSGQWHRRWLQYRHLAETLRMLPYLQSTGVAVPPFLDGRIGDLRRGGAHAKSWTRWYAAALWRQMAGPEGHADEESVTGLARLLVEKQLQPQAEYHRANAARMHRLDHRMHIAGNILMAAVIIACLIFLIGYVTMQDMILANVGWFVLATAGLPTIGAAIFGIRGHGEYLLAASRSARTATELEAAAERMQQVRNLDALATEIEAAASVMLADLGEWTQAYQEKQLNVPA